MVIMILLLLYFPIWPLLSHRSMTIRVIATNTTVLRRAIRLNIVECNSNRHDISIRLSIEIEYITMDVDTVTKVEMYSYCVYY